MLLDRRAMPANAAVYCRISKDRTDAGLGVERQRGDCQGLADRLGWTVSDVYLDNDLSAYTPTRHGQQPGGGIFYGHTAKREAIVPHEAERIREAAGRILTGEALRSVVKDWNTQHLPSRMGKQWSTTSLRRMLTSWATCGIRS